jgi:hypothetical protein
MPRTFLKRLVKTELDARRVERVFRKYDRACGYERFHAHCRAAFRRTLSNDPIPLIEEGVECLRVMNEEATANTLRQIRERFESERFRKNADRVHAYRIDDEAFARQLLSDAFTPEVDDHVARFFGSEYFVHWFIVNRAMPRPEENFNSFLWHCDKGPRAHLKLLIDLNGVQEHGGRSDFLNLEETRKLADSGYLFGAVAERRSDLSSLAASVGVEFRPRSWRLAAGEGLLFQPSSVLHRGVMPSDAPRYLLAICLLPSPVPWEEALRRGVMSDLSRDAKWHRDAMDVARRLGPAHA